MRERFVLEGRLLRRVASPHVLDVHAVGQTERAQPFLVLELAHGGDLASRVGQARSEGRRPTTEDVLTVVDAVADALGAMHRGRVVHRDLAPANLLLVGNGAAHDEPATAEPPQGGRVLRPDERVCVADLGLSKDLARASGLTVSGGTAGFTPPEQRERGSWVDVRADIWSASALVVWLLTGEAPGDDGGWRQTLEAGDLPVPVRSALTAALSRGLSRSPDDRPATSELWHREVTAAFTPSLPQAPTEGAEQPARPAPRRWTSLVAMLAAGVVVAALAAFAGWTLGRSTGDDGSSTRTTTENGEVRVETSQRDATVVLTGPQELEVGVPATLEVEVDGVADWVWITPDGNTYPNTRSVEVTLTSPGTTRAVLVARDEDGRMLDASLTLTAVDE